MVFSKITAKSHSPAFSCSNKLKPKGLEHLPLDFLLQSGAATSAVAYNKAALYRTLAKMRYADVFSHHLPPLQNES